MCANSISRYALVLTPLELDELQRSFQKMLKEAQEFEAATAAIENLETEPDHLRWKN